MTEGRSPSDRPAAGRGGETVDARMVLMLWRAARAQAFHGPGCSCCGGASAVTLDAAALREDIEYMLRRRYEGVGRPDLLTALDRAAEGGPEEFPGWIARLEAQAPAEAAAAIFGDIAATLRSMGAGERGTR